MSSIVMYFAGICILLVVLSFIPGLNHFVKPMVDLMFSLLKSLLEHGYSWFIWGIKRLFQAHIELFKNFTSTKEEIDPTEKVKK